MFFLFTLNLSLEGIVDLSGASRHLVLAHFGPELTWPQLIGTVLLSASERDRIYWAECRTCAGRGGANSKPNRQHLKL